MILGMPYMFLMERRNIPTVQQWGNGIRNQKTKFPISFNKFVKVQATCYAGEWAWVTDIGLNSFRLMADADGFWLAIGI